MLLQDWQTAPYIGKKVITVEEMKIMKCPNCGFEVEEQMQFCGKCGTSVVEKDSSESEDKEIVTDDTKQSESKEISSETPRVPSKRTSIIVGVLSSIVVTVLVIALLAEFGIGDASSENKDSADTAIDTEEELGIDEAGSENADNVDTTNDTEEEIKLIEGNNEALLEYAMKKFDGRTHALFVDITHDGNDELLVYDDTEYKNPNVAVILRKIYIYSYDGEQVFELDKIDASNEPHTCASLYIYEEDGKSYFVEKSGDNFLGPEYEWDTGGSNTFTTSGSNTFTMYYYKDGCVEKLFENSFQKDEDEEWTDELIEEWTEFDELVQDYFYKSSCHLLSCVGGTEDRMSYPPESVRSQLQDLCLEYNLITQDQLGGDFTAGNQELESGISNEDSELQFEGDICSSPSEEITYYSGDISYYIERYDGSEEIVRFNTYTNTSERLYYNAPYKESVINVMEYLMYYRGILYGSSWQGKKICKFLSDGTVAAVINNPVTGRFCIMDNTLYYLEDISSENVYLCSYNLETEEKTNIKTYSIEEIVESSGVCGVTKSYILICKDDGIYEILDRNGTGNCKELAIDNLQISPVEDNCVYGSISDSIVKVNLDTLEILSLVDSSVIFEKMCGLTAEQFNKVHVEGVACNENYVIAYVDMIQTYTSWYDIAHTREVELDETIGGKVVYIDLNTGEMKELLSCYTAHLITDEEIAFIWDVEEDHIYYYDEKKGLQMIE